MKSTSTQTANDMQWLNQMIGYHFSSPNIGHMDDVPYLAETNIEGSSQDTITLHSCAVHKRVFIPSI